MALASVAERIQISLADYLKRDRRTITPAYSLRDDLGLDSMATIELLFRIEEAFEIQIPDEGSVSRCSVRGPRRKPA